jgi:hypothetical protein
MCPDYICPNNPPLESCANRATDKTKCAYWSGINCTETMQIGDNITTISEAGVTYPPTMNRGNSIYTNQIFKTPVQEYKYFVFDIDKPERDIAFILTISDGTDLDIFASQEVINPGAESTGRVWRADEVNDAGDPREVLQICGEFGYDNGARKASGWTASDPVHCSKPDINVVKGKMYVGVLAHLNDKGLAESTYTLEIKIDKCTAYSCKAGNGNCNTATGVCECNKYPGTSSPMWEGTSCDSPVCDSPKKGPNANIACSGQGTCVLGSDKYPGSTPGLPFCDCHPGYEKLNNTLCELPAKGQLPPITVPASTVLSSNGYYFSSSAVGNEGKSLNLEKYQMFSITFPDQYTVVTVNVTGKVAVDSTDANALSGGQPDMIVAATQGFGLKSDFTNEVILMDYDGWVTRDLSSHDTIFRTTRPKQKWSITVLSTSYARSALDYKIRIKATAPTSSVPGDCSKLSWEYATCSGGKGTCVIGLDNTPICTNCIVDPNKGQFEYSGPTCGQKLYPVPAYKMDDPTVPETEKILVPGKKYISGDHFGQSNSVALEPGEWSYFLVNTRNEYNSLSFQLKIENTELVQRSGVLSPILLVKPADSGAALPSLSTDPKTLFDFEGSKLGEQIVTIEGSASQPISARYYVAVYNQRYSGAALEYKVIVSSTKKSVVSYSCLNNNYFLSFLLKCTIIFIFFFILTFFLFLLIFQSKPTCASSPCSIHSSKCVDDATNGRTCTCHPAWSGTTCTSPVLRSTSSLLMATSNIINLGNNDNNTVEMKRGDFRFFKIPQPLKDGQGVMVMVCDTQVVTENTQTKQPFLETDRRLEEIDTKGECCQGEGCSDPDIYIATELPRTSYDFRLIGASPNGSKEELIVYNSSSTGRYYLAVYANYDGNFLVASKATTPPKRAPLATDNYFLQLVGEWLVGTTSGTVTLVVLCVLMCVLCSGCMFACCCEHESLHKHHDEEPKTFRGRAAATFSGMIGSRHPDHNHSSNQSFRQQHMRSSGNLQQPRYQNNPHYVNGANGRDIVQVQMKNMGGVGHVGRVGRGRGEKTII